MLGGYTDETVNDIWISSNGYEWTQLDTIDVFESRKSHTVLNHNGKLVTIAGWRESGILSDVWISSDKGLNWLSINKNAEFGERTEHSSVVFRNSLFLIAGRSSSVVLNDVYKSVDGG